MNKVRIMGNQKIIGKPQFNFSLFQLLSDNLKQPHFCVELVAVYVVILHIVRQASSLTHDAEAHSIYQAKTHLIYRASTYKLPTIFLIVKPRFPNPLEGYVPVVSRIVGPRGVKILHYPLLLFVFHRHSLYHLHSPQQQHKSSRTSFLKSFEISTLH